MAMEEKLTDVLEAEEAAALKPDYEHEIIEIIRGNASPKAIQAKLDDYHANDIAEVMGDLNAPEVKTALLTMVREASRLGVPVGALGMDPAFVAELFDAGLDYLAYGIDTILMYQKCREIMASLSGMSHTYFCTSGTVTSPPSAIARAGRIISSASTHSSIRLGFMESPRIVLKRGRDACVAAPRFNWVDYLPLKVSSRPCHTGVLASSSSAGVLPPRFHRKSWPSTSLMEPMYRQASEAL